MITTQRKYYNNKIRSITATDSVTSNIIKSIKKKINTIKLTNNITLTINNTTTALSINNLITTLVILECHPTKGSSTINIYYANCNIFNAMKHIDMALKLVTLQGN